MLNNKLKHGLIYFIIEFDDNNSFYYSFYVINTFVSIVNDI